MSENKARCPRLVGSVWSRSRISALVIMLWVHVLAGCVTTQTAPLTRMPIVPAARENACAADADRLWTELEGALCLLRDVDSSAQIESGGIQPRECTSVEKRSHQVYCRAVRVASLQLADSDCRSALRCVVPFDTPRTVQQECRPSVHDARKLIAEWKATVLTCNTQGP